MRIGAAALLEAWGTPMALKRAGVTLIPSFKGRFYNNRPEAAELEYSVDQQLFRIITSYDNFAGSPTLFPQKFDVITDLRRNIEYTVQYAFDAGAEEPEVVRIIVKGGQA